MILGDQVATVMPGNSSTEKPSNSAAAALAERTRPFGASTSTASLMLFSTSSRKSREIVVAASVCRIVFQRTLDGSDFGDAADRHRLGANALADPLRVGHRAESARSMREIRPSVTRPARMDRPKPSPAISSRRCVIELSSMRCNSARAASTAGSVAAFAHRLELRERGEDVTRFLRLEDERKHRRDERQHGAYRHHGQNVTLPQM